MGVDGGMGWTPFSFLGSQAHTVNEMNLAMSSSPQGSIPPLGPASVSGRGYTSVFQNPTWLPISI